nr:hypothetical protein [Entomoneis sp.]
MVKIKLLFIESYSSSVVEKRMQIKAFLSQFRRSNQKIAKIKKEILSVFNDLQKKDLIDSRFKLVSETGKEDKLTKLSTSSFTKCDTICFYEKIQSKEIIKLKNYLQKEPIFNTFEVYVNIVVKK